MTIKLLASYGKYPWNAIITLDAATEASLISEGDATSNLTGGVVWVDPNVSIPLPGLSGGGGDCLSFANTTTMNDAVVANSATWTTPKLLICTSDRSGVYRFWAPGNTSARNAILPGGKIVTLAGTSNVVNSTTGKPSDASGADGDVRIDVVGGYYYTKTAGAWDNGQLLAGNQASFTLSADRMLTAADMGRMFVCSTALTVTVPVGLNPRPNVIIIPPPSGNLSVAVSGATTLNGAATTLTRTRANNPTGVSLVAYEAEGYGLSGT